MFIFKKKGVLVWSIVTVAVIAIVIVLNVLLLGVFADLFSTLGIGKPTPKYADGIVSMYPAVESTSKEEATANANAKNIEIAEEGMVLLKNENALPLPENARVSVFGKNSVNLSYGGSGSGGFTGVTYKTIYDSLDAAGITANPELKKFYEDDSRSGAKRAPNSDDLDSGGNQMIAVSETPVDKYDSTVTGSYASDYKDAALVVITRIGGEGFDLPRYQGDTEGAVSEDAHYLELDKNEIDMINMVCDAGFERVIVLFNIPSAMEASFVETNEDIDAAIWMGFTGGEGIMALGSILNGDVNPSGKLVDTWSANFKKDPTFVNFGTGPTPEYSDRITFSDSKAEFYFVDYEEGIYTGYRYYETRYATYDGPVAALESEGDEDFATADEWYAANVVYPFGYGLSYTTFERRIVDKPSSPVSLAKGETVTVTVEVTNTGDVAGKDIVQLYCELPYTEGEIEKPAKVLVGFAKTGLLEKGDSEELEIVFDPYYAASYDYIYANDNGEATFELDAGDYTLCVSENAHDVIDTIPCTVASDIIFDEAVEEGTVVENRYTGREGVTDSGAHLQTRLSRSDWSATWPAAPTEDDRVGSDELLAEIRDSSHNNPNDYSAEEYPYFEEPVTVRMRDLLPEATPDPTADPIVSYDDERWDALLNACSPEELIDIISHGAYHTNGILDIGLPDTLEGDGPGGFTCFMNPDDFSGTCNYVSEPVMAATWNVELMREMGNCLGEEGAWGSAASGMPYSGIYAPGVNIHRSFFGGRCSEYFSEDPFISGRIAAAEILGAQEKGVACYVKHFAANEQETHRSIGGDLSWVDEQALREIYLRPFEMAVKEGKSRAIMSSFNRIGTKWTGGDYRLLTEILRNEWGFKGTVICDFNTCHDYMFADQMAYAGGDLNLDTVPVDWCDPSDTADAIVLRQCAKNIMYTVINSNAMNGEIIGYGLSTLAIIVIVVDCVVAVGLAVWGFFAIRKALKAPDKTPDEAGGDSKQ